MELKEVIKLILSKYDGRLYNSALTKLVYLLDVESVRETGKQVTNIKWRREQFGPFVWDVINCAEENINDFRITYAQAQNGEKKLISLTNSDKSETESDVGRLIDVIRQKTPDPNTDFFGFRDYVYDTVPMRVCMEEKGLDVEAAIRAEKEVEELLSELDTPEWDEAFEYLAAH